MYIVIAPARTDNDIINKIAVIKTNHGNKEIWSQFKEKFFIIIIN